MLTTQLSHMIISDHFLKLIVILHLSPTGKGPHQLVTAYDL